MTAALEPVPADLEDVDGPSWPATTALDATTALVALRNPGEGKTRLSPSLSRSERAEVARAMARDVTAALADAGVGEVLVVAEGAPADRFARSLGLGVLRDRGPQADLNSALRDALQTVGSERAVMLVCADLPGLRAEDVIRVATTRADVVVAPTHDGGTGGLLLRPGARFPLAYGPGSAAAHRTRARVAGLRVTEVVSPGFHHDVDEPQHLHQSVTRWPASQTARTVRAWRSPPSR